jgi:hypothetical protein
MPAKLVGERAPRTTSAVGALNLDHFDLPQIAEI